MKMGLSKVWKFSVLHVSGALLMFIGGVFGLRGPVLFS